MVAGYAINGSVAEWLAVVRMKEAEQSLAAASATLECSANRGRKWWRRYQRAGEAARHPSPPPVPGPLARFAPSVAAGETLPSVRTIHRAWVAADLAALRPPRCRDLADPHAVWQIDHQDYLDLAGGGRTGRLQRIRAPAVALVGADLFPGPHGAHAVPLDEVLDGVRRAFGGVERQHALCDDFMHGANGRAGGTRAGITRRVFPVPRPRWGNRAGVVAPALGRTAALR